MLFEIEGKIIEIFDAVQITDSFKKREFILDHTENNNGRDFTDLIKFQVTQDRCSTLDTLKVDDLVKVTFNIRGRKWDKDGRSGYFTSLEAWKIEKTSSGTDFEGTDPIPPDEILDDLPF